ncbi:ArsR/SmtB family transcription factor [Actinomadura nitritigenes]|uniref:ArsR/SmtB family transcription factor n=1 Tax=Actinomadura nitritigenes TaxID=134602 RepID=UPI0036837518
MSTATHDDASFPAEDQELVTTANARFFRALGDPTRIAIIQLLLARPHTVSELVKELDVPQSRVSNHLACLRWCRFVGTERKGRQVVYSISDPRIRDLLQLATRMAGANLEHLAASQRTGPDWL